MKVIGSADSKYLYETRVTFENIQKSAEISSVLEGYGYDAARIQDGLALHGEAEVIFRKMVKARRKRKSKMAATRELLNQIQPRYRDHLKRLRKELQDHPTSIAELGINGRRKRSIGGFIEEAIHFYDTALTDSVIAAQILPLGFTPEVLQAERDELTLYQTLRSEYEQIAGECQKMGVERDKAFAALRKWIGALGTTCRVAFKENLQTMEEIKFFVRNSPKPKKTTTDTTEPADPGTEPGTDSDTGVEEGTDGSVAQLAA